jgi:hypothetical protein
MLEADVEAEFMQGTCRTGYVDLHSSFLYGLAEYVIKGCHQSIQEASQSTFCGDLFARTAHSLLALHNIIHG